MNKTEPTNQCTLFFTSRCLEAKLISKKELDSLTRTKSFTEGPFKESFGDGYGEPYNPNRQIFGILKDGSGVYCNL